MAAGLGFFGFKVFERFSPGLAGQGVITGNFSISSSPPGATVRWRGQEIGKTPLANYPLPQGDQTIELVLPNQLTRPIEFTVKHGETADLGTITLTKESGRIQMTTIPSSNAFGVKSSSSPTPAATVSATPAPVTTSRTIPTATVMPSTTPVPNLETPSQTRQRPRPPITSHLSPSEWLRRIL